MRSVWRPIGLAGLILLLASGTVAWRCSAPDGEPQEFRRGMTISCPRAGAIWGTDDMDVALAGAAEVGANWVAIHPYARIRQDGSVTFNHNMTHTDGYLAAAVGKVAARQQQLMLKPHLAYWGQFESRGAITFTAPDQWRRFFEGYREFIVEQARFAARYRVPILSLGVELDQTTARPEWLEIIKAVRRVYSGHLTYAANWDSAPSVPFWDQLDSIGVQAYYPVSAVEPASDAAPTELPSEEELASQWDRIMADLDQLRDHTGRREVIFTEIGYDRSPYGAIRPWESFHGGDSYAPLRQRLMTAALQVPARYPWLKGMFWWKWMPGEEITGDQDFGGGIVRDGDFSMRHEEARQALSAIWRADL